MFHTSLLPNSGIPITRVLRRTRAGSHKNQLSACKLEKVFLPALSTRLMMRKRLFLSMYLHWTQPGETGNQIEQFQTPYPRSSLRVNGSHGLRPACTDEEHYSLLLVWSMQGRLVPDSFTYLVGDIAIPSPASERGSGGEKLTCVR